MKKSLMGVSKYEPFIMHHTLTRNYLSRSPGSEMCNMHYESGAYYKVRESCKVVGNGLAAGRAVVAAWQLSWCGNLVGLCQRLTLEERALTSSLLSAADYTVGS